VWGCPEVIAWPVPWFAVETDAAHLALVDTLSINPLNAAELIAAFGLIGVLAIIFAETGLLVGFFFPGDSLLFLAGIAASPFANEIFEGAQLNIWALLIGAPICAIAGAQLGHHLGARYGRRMFYRPNSRIRTAGARRGSRTSGSGMAFAARTRGGCSSPTARTWSSVVLTPRRGRVRSAERRWAPTRASASTATRRSSSRPCASRSS
jgi:hypothetical protein